MRHRTIPSDRRPAPSRRRREAGFTLFELMIALTIMALGTAVVAPRLFAGGDSLEARTAGRQVAAILRQVRTEAIRDHREAVVTVDAEAARLSGAGASMDLPEGMGVRLLTAAAEQESETRGTIRFFPDGSSTGGRITLGPEDETARDGAPVPTIVVGVDWLTGRVRIRD